VDIGRQTWAVVKTLHPKNYDEVFYVGHYFREGKAVVMDLTSMSDAEATPLVDFAGGLVVGRGGTLERVAAKVFLLLPPEMVDVGEPAPV
jgi:FtsZ-interacting cell division protein YlmF